MRHLSKGSFAVLKFAVGNDGCVSMLSRVGGGATLTNAALLVRSGHLSQTNNGSYQITEKGRAALRTALAHPAPCRPVTCSQCGGDGRDADEECASCLGSGQRCQEHYSINGYAPLLEDQTSCESPDAAAAKGKPR